MNFGTKDWETKGTFHGINWIYKDELAKKQHHKQLITYYEEKEKCYIYIKSLLKKHKWECIISYFPSKHYLPCKKDYSKLAEEVVESLHKLKLTGKIDSTLMLDIIQEFKICIIGCLPLDT